MNYEIYRAARGIGKIRVNRGKWWELGEEAISIITSCEQPYQTMVLLFNYDYGFAILPKQLSYINFLLILYQCNKCFPVKYSKYKFIDKSSVTKMTIKS